MHKQFPCSAIQDAYRLTKSKDVVLTFKDNQLDRKVDIQQSTKALWTENQEHLTTDLIDGDEQNQKNIYIFPRLSAEMSHLHYLTRQIPQDKLKYKWICARTHKLYIKKNENDNPTEITSQYQLVEFQ
eukprot:Lithocolla_globosa_v1_NODE_101_length_6343_cov_18.219454.p3 type:complete len:128 gc:universal NODE_101_length_6343_cov_18.219454:4350-4733(+)